MFLLFVIDLRLSTFTTKVKQFLMSLSFTSLTKAAIIGHYIVFHGLIPVVRWLQFSWFGYSLS